MGEMRILSVLWSLPWHAFPKKERTCQETSLGVNLLGGESCIRSSQNDNRYFVFVYDKMDDITSKYSRLKEKREEHDMACREGDA